MASAGSAPKVRPPYFQEFLEKFREGWRGKDEEAPRVYEILSALRGPDLPDSLAQRLKAVFTYRVRGFFFDQIDEVEEVARNWDALEDALSWFCAEWEALLADEERRRGLAHYLEHAERALRAISLLSESLKSGEPYSSLGKVARCLRMALLRRDLSEVAAAIKAAIDARLVDYEKMTQYMQLLDEEVRKAVSRAWLSRFGYPAPWEV